MINKHSYIKEKVIAGQPNSISLETMKYMMIQMENSVCKLKLKIGAGTGFFCKIPFPDSYNLLPVLITNNHVLNEKDIIEGEVINLSLNNEKLLYKITIGKDRKVYTSKEYDITIIQIMPNDGLDITSFLDIDERIFQKAQIFNDQSVYLIHYPKGDKVGYSIGTIKLIEEDSGNIRHLCSTEFGSAGSPIINLSNLKIIGIHKGAIKNGNFNLGTFMKNPIEDFNKLYEKDNKITINLNDYQIQKEESLLGKDNIQLEEKIKEYENTIKKLENDLKEERNKNAELSKKLKEIENKINIQ